ncbi:MAG: 4a-hydroxytetrahydrobiopterin dehydratase [Candidatus Caenarcaniphilales bacterium]|nr:4a-hydroxytetrahydrobiopterin dehydratase [Candidatus Caenarcaniphilales bacterium]
MLTLEEINKEIQKYTGWKLIEGLGTEPNIIQKEFSFNKYLEGIGFVHKVAQKAEEANHHPDILIKYAKVIVSISTHDAGGVTEKDFQLAQKIDLLVNS